MVHLSGEHGSCEAANEIVESFEFKCQIIFGGRPGLFHLGNKFLGVGFFLLDELFEYFFGHRVCLSLGHCSELL